MPQESKSPSMADYVESRLREVGFWPCPETTRSALLERFAAQFETSLKGSLKDFESTAKLAAQLAGQARPTPPAPLQGRNKQPASQAVG